MYVDAFRHSRLMQESELRVEIAAHSHAPADAPALRLFERRATYLRWEAEHDRLMRMVSEQVRLARQVIALRNTAFSLVHRRAMFEYLRDRRVMGRKRERLFSLFYGCRDFSDAVLKEHGNYVRCASSFLCTTHLAENLMQDAAFGEPLQLYEEFYRDYFRAYCDVELAETPDEKSAVAATEALRPLLKKSVCDARAAILAMPPVPDEEWHEIRIRRPNGDTQRVRVLFGGD